MAGLVGYGAYLPYWRLQRSAIAGALGTRRRQGHCAASPPTTRTPPRWASRPARLALALAPDGVDRRRSCVRDHRPGLPRQDQRHRDPRRARPRPRRRGAFDFGRLGALAASARCGRRRARRADAGRARPTSAPACPAAPTSATAATAPPRCVFGDGADADRRARRRRVGDRRVPRPLARRRATPRSQAWEERFGETPYVPLAEEAVDRRAEGGRPRRRRRRPRDRHRPARRAPSARWRKRARRSRRGARRRPRRDRRQHRRRPRGLLLADVLERAEPGQIDRARGAGRRRRRLASCAPTDALAAHRAAGARSRSQPDRRPAATTSPTASSSPGAASSTASRRAGPSRTARPAPPSRAPRTGSSASSAAARRVRRRAPAAGAGLHAAAAPSTRWSRCAWPTCRARSPPSPSTASRTRPSPPVVVAVVDFDGGGRFQSSSPTSTRRRCAIGDRVEMTFRRLFTADGIHNYFWKARPVRGARGGD